MAMKTTLMNVRKIRHYPTSVALLAKEVILLVLSVLEDDYVLAINLNKSLKDI